MNMFLQPPPAPPAVPSTAPSAGSMFGLTSAATATSPPMASPSPTPVTAAPPLISPPSLQPTPAVGLPAAFDPFASLASPPPQHQNGGAVVGPPTNIPQLAPAIPQQPPALFAGAPLPGVVDPDASKNEADLTAEYIALRNKKTELNQQAKEALEPVEARMDEIERKMLARLQAGGVESFKTTAGTAFKKLKTYFNVEDSEQLMSWVESTGNQQVLKRDVRQDEIRSFMDDNGYVPPGVKVTSEFVVQFRK